MTTGPPASGGAREEEPTRADPLSTDRLLRACTRAPFEAVQRPVLGRILITAPVGKGGMGAVYRGIHRTLGQERAVKVLLASADDALRERFLREARFAAQIDSPHLVRVHDADEDPVSGLVYLEMEYVRGTSAALWMREAVLSGRVGVPEDDALVVCAAACRGLEAAHAAGVVHRDLKPGNILLPEGADGRPNLAAAKVADLGLARSEEADASLTATNTFVGTPGFAAPEQISDAKRAGKSADVFSMGATLYALLSGRSPFDGTSSSDTIVRTTLGRRTPLPELRRGLSAGTLAIVDRCLSMDPADRYPDATALREAIENRLSGAESPTTVGAPWAQGPSEESTVGSPVPAPRPRHVPPTPLPAAPTTADPVAAPPVGSGTPEKPQSASAPPVAGPPPLVAGSSPPAAPEPAAPSPARKVGPWVAAAVAVAGLAAVLLVWSRSTRGPATGPQDGTPSGQRPVDPEATPRAEPGAPGAMATARLTSCPPGSRVFLGDRQIREGEKIPLGLGRARVELDGHETQTVSYAPNESGEIWVRPGPFKVLTGRLVIGPLGKGVQASIGGQPVAGSLDDKPGDEVTIEFRYTGFHPQTLTERVPQETTLTLEPRELWVWSGEVPIGLARGGRLAFEMSYAFEGEMLRDGIRLDPEAPGGVEWEVECLDAAPAESKLRLRLTRIHGRVLVPEKDALPFDSAAEGWAALLATHEKEIAEVAPLALLRSGPIDVTFGADGRPRTWNPFPSEVPGLVGVAEGGEEDVRRSVIGLLTLRPDVSGVEPLGSFSYTGSDDESAQLFAYLGRDGVQLRSALRMSLKDGLGLSLEVERKVPKRKFTAKATARRK